MTELGKSLASLSKKAANMPVDQILEQIIVDFGMIKSTRKIKKSTLAIEVAALATPPNPISAAISAMMRKITLHLSICIYFG